MRDIEGRPLFLSGTNNKESAYKTGIYVDIHSHFPQTLNQVEKLIICGYGFGDTGINKVVLDWINSDYRRKIIIVHPNPTELKQEANSFFTGLDEKKREFIEAGTENVTWQEIKARIV